MVCVVACVVVVVVVWLCVKNTQQVEDIKLSAIICSIRAVVPRSCHCHGDRLLLVSPPSTSLSSTSDGLPAGHHCCGYSAQRKGNTRSNMAARWLRWLWWLWCSLQFHLECGPLALGRRPVAWKSTFFGVSFMGLNMCFLGCLQ